MGPLRGLKDERVGVGPLQGLKDERVGVGPQQGLKDERVGVGAPMRPQRREGGGPYEASKTRGWGPL